MTTYKIKCPVLVNQLVPAAVSGLLYLGRKQDYIRSIDRFTSFYFNLRRCIPYQSRSPHSPPVPSVGAFQFRRGEKDRAQSTSHNGWKVTTANPPGKTRAIISRGTSSCIVELIKIVSNILPIRRVPALLSSQVHVQHHECMGVDR